MAQDLNSLNKGNVALLPAGGETEGDAAAVQISPSQAVSAESPQQVVQDQATAEQQLHAHQQAKADAQGAMPPPDWQSTPTDAAPVSSMGSLTAAGGRVGTGLLETALGQTDMAPGLTKIALKAGQSQRAEAPPDVGLQAQHWQAARVVPDGLVLQPAVGEIGAPLLQTPTQLPVFGLDSVLWPNQIMMLR